MIYLDNAATTMPKPPAVYDAVGWAMRHCAGIGRSGHEPAMRAARIAYACRAAAGELFHAQPEQVVFTLNATHGLNVAIRSLVEPGDRVVISGFEHNAVLRPLYALGAELVTAGSTLFDPADTLEAFRQAVTAETKAVVCTHVSNVFGYVLPVAEIAALCRERGVPMILDAAQSAGTLPVSLEELGAAFIAMPGHKGLYGPQGTGLLLCGAVPKPLLFGGTGSLSQLPQMPDFLPDRAEAGTHNVPGIAGLLEGLRYVKQRGLGQIYHHEKNLLDLLTQELASLPHVHCFTGPAQSGVLSVQLRDLEAEYTAQYLAERQIAVRAGLHCAPLAHQSAGTLEQGTVRVSFSDLNTEQDVLALVEALRQLRK